MRMLSSNKDNIKYNYVQLARKLTALSLDGAILANNEDLSEILEKAQQFL